MVDSDVVEAAVNYVKYGLHPGGCCMQMILGNLEGAAMRCHPLAAECLPATYEAVRSVVPKEARDSAEAIVTWFDHKGLSGKPLVQD